MTTKTTYKVGDKVRILDAKGICAGFDLVNGKEYPISKIDSDGDIYVIDGAKAFVEKYTPIVQIDETPLTSEHGDVKITLNVNVKKHTVACIVHYLHVKDAPIKRGFAKCAPDDVFNADIGKAIALGRALGLDVSKFEKAVQPTEFTVGQWIDVKELGTGRDYLIAKALKVNSQSRIVFEEEGATFFRTRPYFNMEVGVHGDAKIIDDTEAQY